MTPRTEAIVRVLPAAPRVPAASSLDGPLSSWSQVVSVHPNHCLVHVLGRRRDPGRSGPRLPLTLPEEPCSTTSFRLVAGLLGRQDSALRLTTPLSELPTRRGWRAAASGPPAKSRGCGQAGGGQLCTDTCRGPADGSRTRSSPSSEGRPWDTATRPQGKATDPLHGRNTLPASQEASGLVRPMTR